MSPTRELAVQTLKFTKVRFNDILSPQYFTNGRYIFSIVEILSDFRFLIASYFRNLQKAQTYGQQ